MGRREALRAFKLLSVHEIRGIKDKAIFTALIKVVAPCRIANYRIYLV
jgi:hypothetical protein